MPHKAPKQFDVILTNPPFGGKEGKDAQKNFAFETGSTQVLFVHHPVRRDRTRRHIRQFIAQIARFWRSVQSLPASLVSKIAPKGAPSLHRKFPFLTERQRPVRDWVGQPVHPGK
jgi:hypothetical protein